MSENITTVQEINERARLNPATFIVETEAGFRKKIDAAVKRIAETQGCKFVLLAGPSASGKTTSAVFIERELEKAGVNAHSISLDNFYKDQKDSPEYEDGSPDYESVLSLDLPELDQCLTNLLKQGETSLPLFDFITGKRKVEKEYIRLKEKDVVVVEGIHALNPIITETLPKESRLGIYISVSSRIYGSYDGDVLLGKRDLRFIRRLIRDYSFRSSSTENTFYLWKNVLKGEDKYLFPFKDLADLKIDSFHDYETCVLGSRTVSLLKKAVGSAYTAEAERLIGCLNRFVRLEESVIPKDSLLREFTG